MFESNLLVEVKSQVLKFRHQLEILNAMFHLSFYGLIAFPMLHGFPLIISVFSLMHYSHDLIVCTVCLLVDLIVLVLILQFTIKRPGLRTSFNAIAEQFN